jgi:hypothetical protein
VAPYERGSITLYCKMIVLAAYCSLLLVRVIASFPNRCKVRVVHRKPVCAPVSSVLPDNPFLCLSIPVLRRTSFWRTCRRGLRVAEHRRGDSPCPRK